MKRMNVIILGKEYSNMVMDADHITGDHSALYRWDSLQHKPLDRLRDAIFGIGAGHVLGNFL